jgi:hypothetical protein
MSGFSGFPSSETKTTLLKARQKMEKESWDYTMASRPTQGKCKVNIKIVVAAQNKFDGKCRRAVVWYAVG